MSCDTAAVHVLHSAPSACDPAHYNTPKAADTDAIDALIPAYLHASVPFMAKFSSMMPCHRTDMAQLAVHASPIGATSTLLLWPIAARICAEACIGSEMFE